MNIPQVIWNKAEKLGLDWVSTGGGMDYIHREIGKIELVLDLDDQIAQRHTHDPTYTDVRQLGEPCSIAIYDNDPSWNQPAVKAFKSVSLALHWMVAYKAPTNGNPALRTKSLFEVRLTDTRVLETRFDSVTNSKKRKRVTKDGVKFWTIETVVEEPSGRSPRSLD